MDASPEAFEGEHLLRGDSTPRLDDTHAQLVTCGLDDLRAHPSYVRHRLSVSAAQLSNLIAGGDLAFRQPIVITRDRKIIDGFARLELARRQGRRTIQCLAYDLSEEESLRFLIQTHLPSRGLSAYCRILLALDLVPSLRERTRAKQQAGGRDKLSSSLTEAKALEVRSEIAAVAAVSTGNITKVIQLRNAAHAAIEQALRDGEISIHRAWQWSQERPKQQLENLRLRRIKRSITKKAKALVAEHRANILPPVTAPPLLTLPDLVKLVSCLSTMPEDQPSAFGTVAMVVLDVPGKAIYVTQELVQTVGSGGACK
jgi:hypothetical protein